MKKVTWGPPKISAPAQKPGTYRSFQDFLKKSESIQAEQKAAQEYLVKAFPAMVALLEYKLQNREPLIVMRPLRYQTSELPENDGFYKSDSPQTFKDKINTILPGTQLMLKSLDMALNEFVFEDAMGTEHAINFVERNNLMTQTSIYEEVKHFLETKGE